MGLIKHLVLLLLLITTLVSSELELTEDELQWIKNSPVIKLGADHGWPPFDFVDSNGNHTGLASEYISLIAKKSGLKFKVYPGIWSNILEDMKAKKYDGLTCAVETDDRKKYLNFSKNYLSVPMVIITLSNNSDIRSIDDLTGKSVSINRGSYIHEWLQSKYPQINLYLTNSNEESMEAVSLGKAEAYVGNLAVSTYIMNKYLFNNLKVVSKLKDFTTSLSVAIDKDNKMLFNIIQKSIKSISPQEHQEIKKRWKENLEVDDKLLAFSDKQNEWINKHKTIKYVIDSHWKPIEYVSENSNNHAGITSDYMNLVSKKTGIEFKLIPTTVWSESVNKINNKEADLYSCVARTDSRDKILNFSDTYFKAPQVFVTNKDKAFIADIKELYGKKVLIVEGYYLVEIIKEQHPHIELIEVENIVKAFNMLTNKKAFAYIGALSIASHNIQKTGFSNLKISGMSGYKSEYSMALRKELGKEGIEVISMALKSITEEEKNDIYNKWIDVKYDKAIDYTLVWQIIAIFLLFILGTLYWNRKLAIEVAKRKLAQEKLEISLADIEQKNSRINKILKMSDNQTRALMELNQKLEKATDIAQNASRAKTDFLSNMSHEIRTPMNAILGFAELLDKRVEDKKSKSFIKTIRSSGQTLLFLINDILDLSKIESGKLELVKSRVNVQSICEENLNIFKLQAEQKGLQLQLDIDKEMPKAILIDSIRLSEILINLIGNALKFTEKGYVKVVVEVNEVYEHTSKVDLTIRVEDSGIGIEKSNQDKIFNIFEQTENQDVKKYGGTGLGLAISRKLSKLMGGSLEVESEIGKGSVFIVSLINIDIASVGDDEDYSKSNLYFNSIEFKKAVVLVVDDVEENRDLVKESFSDTNIEVIEATNGKEAIDILKIKNIDLILMDIRMPVMDGYTATRLIKEFSFIPVVALTASIMEDELKKLEGGKFDGYLRKPVSRNELFKEISRFLSFTDSKMEVENNDEIIVDKVEDLKNFMDVIEFELKELYLQAIETNDMNTIENFAKKLLESASKYNIKYMHEYAKNLIDKIDSFEIDSISLMLEQYEIKIKDLKSKL